jgi:hypothetical protein
MLSCMTVWIKSPRKSKTYPAPCEKVQKGAQEQCGNHTFHLLSEIQASRLVLRNWVVLAFYTSVSACAHFMRARLQYCYCGAVMGALQLCRTGILVVGIAQASRSFAAAAYKKLDNRPKAPL